MKTEQELLTFTSTQPVDLGFVDCSPKEMMAYLYLPVSMAGSYECKYEERLDVFNELIESATAYFIDKYGMHEYYKHYMYVTAKRLFVTPENIGNRPGYHCDGFGTSDINLLWTDKYPTIFNSSTVTVRKDDMLSLQDMERGALPENEFSFPVGHLIVIDSKTLHRTPDITTSGMRTFVKISFSKHQFNLGGNTHNYLFNYDWELTERSAIRNMENKDFTINKLSK